MSNLLENVRLGVNTPENQRLIDNAGRISRTGIAVSIGVLYSIAAVGIILRTIRRLATVGVLRLDDALLWFALLCLSAATALYYHLLPVEMLEEAIAVVPNVVVPYTDIGNLLGSQKYTAAFLCTIWTCTFSAKASFLSLFKQLIQDISPRLTRYFWFVCVYTALTWAFLEAEVFILCPYVVGLNRAKCYPEDKYPKTLGLTALITILDIASDIMIASIPILLLRRSRIKFGEKLSLAIFLCLSLVMAIMALIRCAGLKLGPAVDLNWALFWQFMEGCVACIMASITSFRSLFASLLGSRSSRTKRIAGLKDRLLKRKKRNMEQLDWEDDAGDHTNLPHPPNALLSGVRTFIRRNYRDPGQSSFMMSSISAKSNDAMLDYAVMEEPTRHNQVYVHQSVKIERNSFPFHRQSNITGYVSYV